MATRQKPKRPEDPIALNMARIVHRLMTSPRGWRVDLLCEELGIAERTYRKYRRLLQNDFPGFRRVDGKTMVQQVREEDGQYLRVVGAASSSFEGQFEFLKQVSALHLARQMFHVAGQTDFKEAMEDLWERWKLESPTMSLVFSQLLQHADRMIVHQPFAPKDYGDQQPLLRLLLTALLNSQVIEVVYWSASRNREATYQLEPLTLLSWQSGLYLLARRHGQKKVRTFSVDRMLDVLPLDVHFDYPGTDDYDPRKFTEGSFGLFVEDGGRRHTVELLFADIPWLKANISERMWHPSQSLREEKDGQLRLRFRVSSLVEVAPWVRTFGKAVKVVGPPELIEALSEG